MTREVEWCFCLPQHCAELSVYAHLFFTLRLHVFLSHRLHVFSCFGGMRGIMNACETKGAAFLSAWKLSQSLCLLSACFHVLVGQEHSQSAFKNRQACMHTEHVYV